jgi:hypothetical protein
MYVHFKCLVKVTITNDLLCTAKHIVTKLKKYIAIKNGRKV